MSKTISGPGRLGSMSAVKKSLKKGGNANIKNIPKEDSLTVRFLDEPEDFHGYYEHYVNGRYEPCTTDECDGCDSDDPQEQRKMFRYLANAYVVDDQKVWALKLPKTLVEMLVTYYTKYDGTLLDRDYELSRTGSGQNDTKYMAVPEAPSRMKLSRFEDKKFDLDDVLNSLVGNDDDDDDDDEPVVRKKKKSSSGKPKKSRERDPWEDDDDDEDEPVHPRKKKSSGTVKKKSGTVNKKSSGSKSKPAVKRTVKRK